MDGKKKKVVVQNAEDYYHILPIRPSQSSQRNDQTFQNASCSTTGATAMATLCSICINNGPSSSSHNCASSKKSEGNFKVPTVLKKRRGKKKENVTRNFSIQIEGTDNASDNAKIADVTKKPKRRSVGKAVTKDCSKQENSDDSDLTFFGQCGLKPANSGLSYSESVKEAIVMDLLDKRYGNLIEEKLSIEIEKDVKENNSASGSTGSLLNASKIKVLESSPIKVLDLGDTEIKEEKFDLYFDVQKCMETIEILDSPDKNCTLFSRQELNFLPDKIFDSPLKPRIKAENKSPIDELCELLKSPGRDPSYPLDTFQMINTNRDEKGSLEVQTTIPHTPEDDLKEDVLKTCQLTPEVSVGLDNDAKEVETSVKVENLAPPNYPNIDDQTQNNVPCTQNVSDDAYTPSSLKQICLGVSETGNRNVESKSIEEIEISSEFEENIFGDDTYRQLISSIVENGPLPDIARDLAIVANEEAASDTKEGPREVVEKPREEHLEDSCKKIWEINAHDITFEVLKESFSQRKPQSLDLASADDMTNGFHGFANSSGHEKCFGNLPRTASQESLGATSAESEVPSKSLPQVKKNVKSASTTEAIINLVRHEVVSQLEKVMIIPSISDPNSDEDVVIVDNPDECLGNFNELLHFGHDNCVVETIVTTEGCSDLLKSEQDGIEDIDNVPLIIAPDNTEPVSSEPLNENSGEDVDKYDILILKENGKFKPLDGEKCSREIYLEEHCYCSQVFEEVSVVKQEEEDSNLEYCGPPNDQSEEHSSCDTAVVSENNVESVNEDIAPAIDTLDLIDQEQCNILDQLVDDAPQLFPENLVDETGSKYVVKTDFELAELKNRIMEGNINKEEILEIIESKNIVQYNINVAIPENNLLDQQKREAKHLGTCLKKQIDVMKQTYEYFEEIIDSSDKLLEGNVTELHVKNIFENLRFVKDIVDKTFAYYNTGKNKENKIRYKVISITRKDDKQNQKNLSTRTCKKGGKKRNSKLLPKMLYRMNRLLKYLESYGNSSSKREQNSFITKLKEIARKDFSKLQEIRKRKVLKANRKREPYVLDDESCYSLLEEQSVLSSIENVRENVTRSGVDSCKPVITPLSQGVKIILSQIEQLNRERKTTEEIHRKMLDARCRKTSRISVENTTQERLVIKPGRQDEVILVEATTPSKAAEKEILTAATKRSQSIRRRQSKKENVITCETHADSQWGDVSDVSIRHSGRLRKQTDFYSAEKYSTKVSKPSFEVDCSNVKSSRRTLGRRNLVYDFENKKTPVVVLYEGTNLNAKGNKNSFGKTDTPNRMNVETDFKITKRGGRRDPDPTATRMELRSSGKKKSAVKA